MLRTPFSPLRIRDRKFEGLHHQAAKGMGGRMAEMEKGLELNAIPEDSTPDVTEALCGCQRCTDARPGMPGLDKKGWRYACKRCGNKRCPHHEWHGFKCTGSNEPDQIGELA